VLAAYNDGMSAAEAPPLPVRPWHGVDHYENFPVASWLVPAAERARVQALYRFARYADDVADEGDHAPELRLAELDSLERALSDPACEHHAANALRPLLIGHPTWLADCHDLLTAFRQDARFQPHPDFASLQRYCDHSAAPVGRLMLGFFGCRTPDRVALSDAICSALQLINFQQDLARDLARGRLYLPLDELAAAGVGRTDLAEALHLGRAGPALRRLVASQTLRAAGLLEQGAPLVRQVPWRLGLELRAVLAGGRRIVEKLAAGGFDPFMARPALRASDAFALVRLALRAPGPIPRNDCR
jgi:squalene synthase HpnC